MVSASSFVLASLLAAAPSVELWEFTAPWCQSCEAMTPVVQSLADDGVPVRKIPFDDYRQLAEQAGVSRLPTFLVVSSDGKILGRTVGAKSKRELIELLRQSADPHPPSTTPSQTVIRGQERAPRKPFGRIGNALSALGGRIGGNSPPPTYDEDPFAALPTSEPRRHPLLDAPLQAPARLDGPGTPGDSRLSTADPIPAFAPPQTKTVEPASFVRSTADTTPRTIGVKTPPQTKARLTLTPVQRAFNATVRLRVEDSQGVSLGTGTIIDVHDDEALVLTCGHIFRDSSGKGPVYCDLQQPDGPQRVPGILLHYDLKRDIGLVSFRPGVRVQPVAVAGPGYTPAKGNEVFAIGCNHGAEATTIQNRIIAVNRYQGPANLVIGGRPVDGRSGGGLFTHDGRLIGVCNAADVEDDEGLYAALGLIQAELDAMDLGFIYRDADNTQQAATKNKPAGDAGAPMNFATPLAAATTTANPLATATFPEASDAEVICIVRPKSSPGAPADAGKAYVIDHPSQELLGKLSEELGRRGPHRFTSTKRWHTPIGTSVDSRSTAVERK